MIASIEKTTMLYCPKCRRTYQEGTQRFCDNDGGRLLPAPGQQKSDPAKSGGVFSNLLGKTQPKEAGDRKPSPAPRFIPLNQTEESDKHLTSFPTSGRIFQSEHFLKPKSVRIPDLEDSILELDPLPVQEDEDDLLELDTEKLTFEIEKGVSKPAPRLIDPREIASGTAPVTDRRTNLQGKISISWDNRGALVGQTVKGRYLVTAELENDDEESLTYLAEDQILGGRKAVVRVFMNDGYGPEDFEEKVFAEERVSLSHLNHPNIAGVFDSGELPEGKEFIVSELIEGKSLAEMLAGGSFNTLRTARIIRQASYALSEAHQNGILHRNLRPENIVLTVSEAGIEQVKLTNFGVSRGEINEDNLAFKAPEEIEGGFSTYASDIYSLAIIAFRMLTGQMPYAFETEEELVRAQKRGIATNATSLRFDVPMLTDRILEKALALSPTERYPKARDFGDAFFNALTTVSPWSEDDGKPLKTVEETAEAKTEEAVPETPPIQRRREYVVIPSINASATFVDDAPLAADIHITPKEESSPADDLHKDIKPANPAAWEKRSPEPPKIGSSWRGWVAILGVVALLAAFWGIPRLFIKTVNPPTAPEDTANQTQTPVVAPQNNLLPQIDGDLTPEPRTVNVPEGFQRFQNKKEDLKGELNTGFLGFQVSYPKDWTTKPVDKNFLDIGQFSSNGFPIEQMIVTRYDSSGTMTLDRGNFLRLVEKSNSDLRKSLGESYKVLGQGESSIQNNRWKVYEVKFRGTAVVGGKPVEVWGKRFWLPVQRVGEQNGFVLTLLGTSFSESIKNVDDVGVKGQLAEVLETFEPESFR